MAIFTRRALQRMLDENSALLSREQLEIHVNALNAQGVEPERYLSYEWEVAVLNVFSKIGCVGHETNFGGTSRPDLFFSQMNEDAICALLRAISPEMSLVVEQAIAEATETPEEKGLEFSFIADIATVSDRGLRDRNPVDAFQNEFFRIIKKRGLRPCFLYEIGSFSAQEFARHRRKVKLPAKNQLGPRIFYTDKFKRFLASVKQNPSNQHSVAFIDADTDVKLTYDPTRRGIGGGYPSYRSVSQFDFDPQQRNLKNTVVYRALKSKADQLRQSGYVGRRGIIVCDGGSQLLADTGAMQTRTAPEVVTKFLRESSSVDFVLWIYIAMVEPPYQSSGLFTSRLLTSSLLNRVPQVQTRLDANPRLGESPEGLAFAKELVALSLAVHRCFPAPVSNADNAVGWLQSEHHAVGRSGVKFSYKMGYDGMGPTQISFSARELLEVLAGKTNLQHFLQNYSFAPSDDPEGFRRPEPNPFEQAYDEGRLICEASVERLDDKDDDRITFRFSQPDAAIAPFRMPDEQLEGEPSDTPESS